MSNHNGEEAVDDKVMTRDNNITTIAGTTATTTTTTTIITEGSAQMAIPASENASVFYNPVQVQNRDLSVLVIALYCERRAIHRAVQAKRNALKKELSTLSKEELEQALREYEASLDGRLLVAQQQLEQREHGHHGDYNVGIAILDALAASGLRSMRYWKEIPGVHHICVNDLEAAAVERAHANVTLNHLQDVLLNNNKISNSNNGMDGAEKEAENSKKGEEATTTTNQRPYGICIQHGDAVVEMHRSRRPQSTNSSSSSNIPTSSHNAYFKPPFDVIDLDPYGSAAPFLDAAIQAVDVEHGGGLLCITCTDMRALGGSCPETCFSRYGSIPIPRAGYLQEMALRILLCSLATTAARYGRTIHPLVSVGMDFYIRVFVQVQNDKAGAAQLSLHIGHVYQSTQCPSFAIRPMATSGGKKGNAYQPSRIDSSSDDSIMTAGSESGSALKVGGPSWLGPLHDKAFVSQALQRLEQSNDDDIALRHLTTRHRLRGLLESCRDECDLEDAPLYYKLQDLCSTLHVSATPPMLKVRAALINAGYRATGYHKEPQALKTNAPNRVVWDVLRAWCQHHPPKKAPEEGSAAAKILSQASSTTTEIDFTVPPAMQRSRKKQKESGVARFPENPQPHWGPKPKANANANNRKRKDPPEDK